MSWGAALLSSLAAVVDRPRWWLMALAGLLLRGGFVLFLLPIVILPTPAGLANALAPALVGFVFGSPSASFINLVGAAITTFLAWLLAGGLVAAWLEVALVGEAAGLSGVGGLRLALRAAAVRLASHLPFAIALSWGAIRVVDAIYTELVAPGDVAVPIALRVVLRVPEVIVALLLTWLTGEAAGGLGVRAAVLGPATGVPTSGWRALALGWRDLLRPGSLATLAVTSLLVGAVAAASAASSAFAWLRLREAVADAVPGPLLVYTLGSFTAIWLAGMALVGIVAAVRAAAWTAEAARRRGGPWAGGEPPSEPAGHPAEPNGRHAAGAAAV